MDRGQEDRIFGVIALLIFLSIAMVGFYLLQFSLGNIPGWLMMVGGILLFGRANSFIRWQYRHYLNKEKRLATLLFACGAIIALVASGLEAEIRITSLRMTFTVFGILLVLSGSYFLLSRIRDL